jgi:hypothetical protein
MASKADDKSLPTLHNITVITSVGGAGKTSAIAKIIQEGNDVVCVGPTAGQRDNLAKSLGATNKFTIDELIKHILSG